MNSPLKGLPVIMTDKTETDLDAPIWGARAIASEIKRTERQTFHLLQLKRLPATKVGVTWVTSRRRLQRALGVEAE